MSLFNAQPHSQYTCPCLTPNLILSTHVLVYRLASFSTSMSLFTTQSHSHYTCPPLPPKSNLHLTCPCFKINPAICTWTSTCKPCCHPEPMWLLTRQFNEVPTSSDNEHRNQFSVASVDAAGRALECCMSCCTYSAVTGHHDQLYETSMECHKLLITMCTVNHSDNFAASCLCSIRMSYIECLGWVALSL